MIGGFWLQTSLETIEKLKSKEYIIQSWEKVKSTKYVRTKNMLKIKC